MEFFKKNRIKLQDLLDDAANYVKSVYRQSSNLFSSASPFGQILSVLTKISSLIFYYIEDSITELNIRTATRPSSIDGLVGISGHNPTRAIAAMGDLFLVFNGKYPDMSGQIITIPNFTKIKCKNNNLTYTVVLGQDEVKLNIYQEKKRHYLKIIQGNIESQQFTGTGNSLQSYECNMSAGKYIDNFFVNVFVNGEKWTKFESLYDMTKGEKGCIVKTGLTSGIDVFFGTNNFGTVPPLGSTILVEYLITQGYDGNVIDSNDILFEFQDPGFDNLGNEVDLNDSFNIGIATPISFGVNPETKTLSRILAPKTSRSFVLANTTNYESFFRKMQMFSYINAFTEFSIYDPKIDNLIYILLVPDINKRYRKGENYFSIPLQYFKLSPTEKYKLQVLLEESGQKLLGTIAEFIDPAFKRYTMNVYLNIWEGYNQTVLKEKIVNEMSKYFSSFKRKDFLPKSDLIAIIEQVKGVDSVNLNFVSEDIEYELNLLLKSQTMFSSSLKEEIIFNIYDEMSAKTTDGNIDTLSLQEKSNIIFANTDFKTFVRKHIDDNGDIVLSSNEIPLVRGGFRDRFGKYYSDEVNFDKLCSINIFILKENKK